MASMDLTASSATYVKQVRPAADIAWRVSCEPINQGDTWLQGASPDRRPAVNHRSQSSQPRIHCRRTQSSLDHGHHLYPNLARLALLGCCSRSLCAARCRLVHETQSLPGIGIGCAIDGRMARQTKQFGNRPFGSRQSVRK